MADEETLEPDPSPEGFLPKVGSDSLVFRATRDSRVFAVTDRLLRQHRVEGDFTVEEYLKAGKLKERVEQGAARTWTYKFERPTDIGLLPLSEIVARSKKLGDLSGGVELGADPTSPKPVGPLDKVSLRGKKIRPRRGRHRRLKNTVD